MGRIALAWKQAFEAQGYSFLHISSRDTGPCHPLWFGWKVQNYIRQKKLKPALILAHEPAAGWLTRLGIPIAVFSHGIEERAWMLNRQYKFKQIGTKASLLPMYVRFGMHRRAFKEASLLLLSNQTDTNFLQQEFGGQPNRIHIFRNGYVPMPKVGKGGTNFLFNGTWIPRKGIYLLVSAFSRLWKDYPNAKLTLAGTGFSSADVLKDFLPVFHHLITVIPAFSMQLEYELYSNSAVLVFPSYFEGQSLALTQAMAMGLCPVAANNSGQTDFISHGSNGLLFNSGDSNGLLECLLFCMENPNEVEKMGIEAAQSVKELTWQKVSAEVVEWCKEVMQ